MNTSVRKPFESTQSGWFILIIVEIDLGPIHNKLIVESTNPRSQTEGQYTIKRYSTILQSIQVSMGLNSCELQYFELATSTASRE